MTDKSELKYYLKHIEVAFEILEKNIEDNNFIKNFFCDILNKHIKLRSMLYEVLNKIEQKIEKV